jgi:hypothetical protein
MKFVCKDGRSRPPGQWHGPGRVRAAAPRTRASGAPRLTGARYWVLRIDSGCMAGL